MTRAGEPLPRPCLMLVTDRNLVGGVEGLTEAVIAAVGGGVNAVQVREKDLSDDALADLTGRLRAAIGGRATLLVNGSPMAALLAGADGVHGGEESLPTAALRRATEGRLLVGRSVHSLESARTAVQDGADYLVLGTIFPSRSHPDGETGGVARVRAVTAAVRIPVLAIGGITAGNISDVVGAGAAGVAVISAILGQPDPRGAAQELRAALDRAWRANIRPAAMANRTVGTG